jgi:5-formyltetrahydrofolate cyclo-ligase
MALTQQQMHQHLAMMLEHFQHLTFTKADYVLSYIPMLERNEATPQYFEETLREDYTDYRLCFPRTDFALPHMEAVLSDEEMQTATNQYGVTEPVNGTIIAPDLLDIIFVPLAAFDTKGYRVGYGKGFYDRFIPRCRQDVVTIGLSFFEPVDEITDAHQFDVPLKYCITPHKLYEF